jgi:F-type H+-transporting ATPase subunit c
MDLTAIAIGLKAIGVGLTMIAGGGAALGIGLIGLGATNAIGRNPNAAGAIQVVAILLTVFAEACAIYGTVLGILIIFVMPVK